MECKLNMEEKLSLKHKLFRILNLSQESYGKFTRVFEYCFRIKKLNEDSLIYVLQFFDYTEPFTIPPPELRRCSNRRAFIIGEFEMPSGFDLEHYTNMDILDLNLKAFSGDYGNVIRLIAKHKQLYSQNMLKVNQSNMSNRDKIREIYLDVYEYYAQKMKNRYITIDSFL